MLCTSKSVEKVLLIEALTEVALPLETKQRREQDVKHGVIDDDSNRGLGPNEKS